MLQSASLVDVVNKALPYKSLGDSLLPVNNNAEFMSHTNAITVAICSQEKPVAFGSIVKCNEKQAYVMLGEVDKEFQDKTVWVEKAESDNKLNMVYNIVKSIPLVDYSGETHFEQTFANREEKPVHLHLMDTLINNSVGLMGMDVWKNITVDFEKYENYAAWRDISGFIVADKYLFEKLTVNRFELLSLGTEDSGLVIENANPEKLDALFDYDAEISIYDRENFVSSLVKTAGVSVKLAKNQGCVVGYVASTKDNILQCYGEDEKTQRALLAAAANDMNPLVNMFARKESSPTMDQLAETAVSKTGIARMNTRVIINTIKWNKVACLNMGLHLF